MWAVGASPWKPHASQISDSLDVLTLFLKGATPVANKKLGFMSANDFKAHVQQGIMTYEREYKELHMLLFDEVLDHIARVDKVLTSRPGIICDISREAHKPAR